MLCFRCESLDFQFVYDLPEHKQQLLRRWGTYLGLGSDGAEDYYFYILQDTFGDLLASARRRCLLCKVILTAILYPPVLWKTTPLDINRALAINAPIILRTWCYTKKVPWKQNSCINDRQEVEVIHEPSPKLKFKLVRDLPESILLPSHDLETMLFDRGEVDHDCTTGSRASLALVKQWYENCANNHWQCRALASALPKRVIDVTGFSPQVIETEDGQAGKYVALSHCWGDPSSFTETRKWVADPSHLPPLDEWPLTFQHVAHVCRSLKIPYLWIDAACITQNDDEDFTRESAKMAQYFMNADLVVAATHAKDSREGCFATRNPLLTRPCRIGFKDHLDGRKWYICWRPPPLTYDEDSEMEPLRKRAWVLQEGLLSRRTVHFCRDQLRWSCVLHKADERSPEGWDVNDLHPQSATLPFLRAFIHHFPHYTSLSQHDRLDVRQWQERMLGHYKMYRPDRKIPEAQRRHPAYLKWYECVSAFTQCNITYKQDILPAISGLAQQMHRSMDAADTYVAGLWRGDFIRGLLWAVFGDQDRLYFMAKAIQDDEYIGPSWSWVSAPHRTISYFFDERIMCDPGPGDTARNTRALMDTLYPQNLAAETQLKSPHATYGQILSGDLRMSARLLHGGGIGSRSYPGVYRKPHPAYHRGIGGLKTETIHTWSLTIPPWFVNTPETTPHVGGGEQPQQKRGFARLFTHITSCLPQKQRAPPVPPPAGADTDIHAEIALDKYNLGHTIGSKPPLSTHEEIFVLPLWPFIFQEDRCLGLGLVRVPEQGDHVYRRVGRVEFVVPHSRLWDWDAEFEEVVII